MQSPAQRAPRLEIGVLYGIRALMVLFVVNYHIWQQGWLGQYVSVGGRFYSFDYFTRSSYMFVDGMMLLSGFLLYLPYARQTAEGTPVPSVGRFYANRLIRIVPSFLLSVFVALFCFALPLQRYGTPASLWQDLLTHLTFTFTFTPQTYIHTRLNVVLWTMAIELQFYLIFPLLARWTQRKPAPTLLGMALVGWAYRFCVERFSANTAMLINQMPAFLDVYALGMLGALAYCFARESLEQLSKRQRALLQLACVALVILGCVCVCGLLRAQSATSSLGYDQLRIGQMRRRLPLALTLLVIFLSACCLPKPLQWLLSNRLMRFLSAISMNLYIWHQFLSVEMRLAWFPDTEALHSEPNQQWAFTVLCYSVSILAAMAATYGWEQPVSRVLHQRLQAATTQRKKEQP